MLSMGAVVEEAKREQLEKVIIGDNEEKFFQVRARVPHRERQQLMDFLRKILMNLRRALMTPLGKSRFHLLPFKRQSICHPQEVTTSALI